MVENVKQQLLEVTDKRFAEVEFAKIRRSPFYFGDDQSPLLGWLHQSLPVRKDVCFVICPPLAVEYMSTYRSLRYMADYLALAGFPVLRFDYHGTGDSSGFNMNENRVPDWLNSVEQSYHFAKELTGCDKVSLLGFRFGATLAALVAEKLPLEHLIVWAAAESGKRFTREVRAVQMTSAVEDEGGRSDILEAGGLVFWPETEQALKQINLLKTTPQSNHTLIIPRDDLSPNQKLLNHWQSEGLSVTERLLSGSSDMLLDAQFTRVPHGSIEQVVHWVEQTSAKQPEYHSAAIDTQQLATKMTTELPAEAPSNIAQSSEQLEEFIFHFGDHHDRFSICTIDPLRLNPQLPRIVIANSGATHRVGPSRLHVLLARQLCAMGFRVFRIDIPGLGDSYLSSREDEHNEYIENSSEEVRQIIHAVNEYFGEGQYVVTGLCSGAYFSFHAALDLPQLNIVESLLINPLTFYWEKGMSFDTAPSKNFGAWNWYRKALMNPNSWKKLLSGKVEYGYLAKTVYERAKIKISSKTKGMRDKLSSSTEEKKQDLDRDLNSIAQNGTHLTFLLAKSDPGYDLLMTSGGRTAKRLIGKNKLSIYMVDGADHTFSKFKPRREAIKCFLKHINERYLTAVEVAADSA